MKKRESVLPIPVRRALSKAGKDIRNARLRRRIQAGLLAERASITRLTLHRLEKGDPGVSIGIYMTVLFVLGMLERMAEVTDATHDRVGLDLADEALPKRIRYSTSKDQKSGSEA